MKKILIIAVCFFIMVLLAGCEYGNKSEKQDSMFRIIESGFNYCVIQHIDTGVMYVRAGYGSYIPMVNADGTPYTGK